MNALKIVELLDYSTSNKMIIRFLGNNTLKLVILFKDNRLIIENRACFLGKIIEEKPIEIKELTIREFRKLLNLKKYGNTYKKICGLKIQINKFYKYQFIKFVDKVKKNKILK